MIKVFIIGGTGAQGIPIVRSLVSDGKYSVRILTRDPESRRAQALKEIDPSAVELFKGSFDSEETLREGYSGCDAAFVNIDGFTVGEKTEMFWAIRAYELAIEDGGIGFFVYGNLEFVYKTSGYDKNLLVGHYNGKGRIAEYIRFQAAEAKRTGGPGAHVGVAAFTTGPYIEMSISAQTPMSPKVEKDENGNDVLTWRVPLTNEGCVPHVSLDDCGHYVRWLFDHRSEADGIDLQVCIDHIRYADLAAAFTKVTGKPSRFIDTDMETYWKEGVFSSIGDKPAGYAADVKDPATLTMKQNFTGFWNIFRKCRPEGQFHKRDYALLDKIHPTRIRSAEDFFQREEKRRKEEGLGGLWESVQAENLKPILKITEDGSRTRTG